jgi:hypothetical protein
MKRWIVGEQLGMAWHFTAASVEVSLEQANRRRVKCVFGEEGDLCRPKHSMALYAPWNAKNASRDVGEPLVEPIIAGSRSWNTRCFEGRARPEQRPPRAFSKPDMWSLGRGELGAGCTVPGAGGAGGCSSERLRCSRMLKGAVGGGGLGAGWRRSPTQTPTPTSTAPQGTLGAAFRCQSQPLLTPSASIIRPSTSPGEKERKGKERIPSTGLARREPFLKSSGNQPPSGIC